MESIQFKRGDTFTLTCTYKVSGIPVDITAIDINAQIRNSVDALIENLDVTKLEDVGCFTLSATANQTALWSLNLLKCDIQFTENDFVRSSNTFFITVIEDVTR